DQNDISTYGLTFSIKSEYGVNFTSIVIEKNPIPSIVQDYEVRPTYNVLHCENFDPNRLRYLYYAQDVDKIELPGLLMELSHLYFEQLGEMEEVSDPLSQAMGFSKEALPPTPFYQCGDCLTRYDMKFGDLTQGIEPGVAFEQLPKEYGCPVCEAPKSSFIKVTPSPSLES
ncbi:MAG: rubredoxin, partial [Bacteroidota bacterium]